MSITCKKIIHGIAVGIMYFLLWGACIGSFGLLVWVSVAGALRGRYLGLYLLGGIIVFCAAFVVAAYTDGEKE